MKKIRLIFVFFVFLGLSAFGYTEEQEEIDFLLFLPDSGNQFADERLAMEHLDNVANYLMNRNLSPGQIHVDGYAAVAANDIEPGNLSRERALFVINELQKRGIPEELFADPVAFGSVDFWGSNADENEKSLNRRVRIFLDGYFLTSGTFTSIDNEETTKHENVIYGKKSKSLWMLLFLLLLLLITIALIILIIFLILRCCKNSRTSKEDNRLLAAYAANGYVIVNLEEEIRRRAYELYLGRNGQNEDADIDWWKAVAEICARYEAAGYKAYTTQGCWWARR